MPRSRLASYIVGFVFSVLFTLDAYTLVVRHLYSHTATMAWLLSLAVLQLIAQLLFFLHLGREKKPRWNLMVFGFMLGVLAILVFGTLWIMKNLDYSHPSANQVTNYLKSQDGL